MKRLTLLMLFALPLAAEDLSCFKICGFVPVELRKLSSSTMMV
jgi:hypothetical protein